MKIAIISSTKDPASVNIKEELINNFDFKPIEEKFDNNEIFQLNNNKIIKLYTINSELIFAEDLDKKIDSELFIFISKHSAAEGKPSLTIHPIGNFGKAGHGGKEKTLCPVISSHLKNIFIELEKNNETEYELTMEVTHHGPFMEKPVLFVEIGSKEEHWKNKDVASIIAKSLMNALSNDKEYESIFVIGGSHYNYIANKVMLKSNFAAGHICAKYNLENLDETLLKQGMERIIPQSKFVLLDWKGLGKEKRRILELLESNNINYKRSDRFFDRNSS